MATQPHPRPAAASRESSSLVRVLILLLVLPAVGGAALFGVRYYQFGEEPAVVMAHLRGEEQAPAATVTRQPQAHKVPQAPAVTIERPRTAPVVHVLFIGNSLTYTNDLPGMLREMAWGAGINLQTDQVTPGGAKLSQHAVNPQVAAKIRAGNWHMVVLQEQSQLPAQAEDFVRQQVFPPAAQLAQMVRASNPTASIIIYDAPAWRAGDPGSARWVPEVRTYDGMQTRVNGAYVTLARELHALLVPVGQTWQFVRHERPALVLYGDERHPNVVGTYLATCVFFQTLFNRSPVMSPFTAGLDDATARYIQTVARNNVVQGGNWDFRR